MRLHLKIAALGCAMALGAGAASAAIYEAPLPSNAYISKNGFDWAWASPVGWDTGVAGVVFDLSYQSQFGWRLPTAQELTLAPLGADFLFPGANVPFNGTDPVSGSKFSFTDANYTGAGACAATYFNSGQAENNFNCNWGNAPDNIANPVPWYGQPGSQTFSEQLVIRAGDTPQIPLPGAAVLMTGALGALAGLRRRKRG